MAELWPFIKAGVKKWLLQGKKLHLWMLLSGFEDGRLLMNYMSLEGGFHVLFCSVLFCFHYPTSKVKPYIAGSQNLHITIK